MNQNRLYLLVGALLVAVIVMGFYIWREESKPDGVEPLCKATRDADRVTIELVPKTKLFAQKLKSMGLDSVLLVTDTIDDNLALAARNLPNVLVVEAQQADPVSLVRFPKVVFTKSAVAKIEEMLA